MDPFGTLCEGGFLSVRNKGLSILKCSKKSREVLSDFIDVNPRITKGIPIPANLKTLMYNVL